MLLGTVPTCFKIIINYSLEIRGRGNHPHYIRTIKLCIPLPMLFSPLVGQLIDTFGFTSLFTATAYVTGLGAVMTLSMIEPRALRRRAGIQSYELVVFPYWPAPTNTAALPNAAQSATIRGR